MNNISEKIISVEEAKTALRCMRLGGLSEEEALESLDEFVFRLRELTTARIVEKIIEKCYNYYEQNDRVNLEIVEGKHKARYGGIKYGTAAYNQITEDIPTAVGEKIICQSEYLGDITGLILKQTYNLNGGIIVKDTQMKRGN